MFKGGYYNSEQLREAGFKFVGENVLISKSCEIVGFENISIGNSVRIDGCSFLIASAGASINIGSFIHIGAHCSLLASANITMGDYSTISHGVKVFTASDDYSGEYMTNPMVPEQYKNVDKGAVVIGEHVIVGANSVILPNITLAEGASVGALSMVNRNLDSWSIYAGAPAKKLRERSRNLKTLANQHLQSLQC